MMMEYDTSSVVEENPRTSGRFTFIIPIFSFSVILLFFVFPFFVDFKVSRIRFENISYISYLVKNDIFSGLGGEGSSISSAKEAVSLIYSLCTRSLWARECKVDFSYPDVVKVSFEEVVPVAFLLENDKVFLVSDRGEKLTKTFSLSDIYEIGLDKFSLPFVVFQSETCSLEEIAEFVKYIKDVKGDFADQIVCFDFSLEIYSKHGYKIILPREDIKSAFLRYVKFEGEISEGVKEIDLRGGEKVFVR